MFQQSRCFGGLLENPEEVSKVVEIHKRRLEEPLKEDMGERIRNIAFDYAYKLGNLVAELADKYDSVTVLET